MFYLMYELNTIHRGYWVHPINVERAHKGELTSLQFDYILKKIALLTMKQDTHFREAVSPEEKLVITITQVLF